MTGTLAPRVIGDSWTLDVRWVLSDGTPIDMTAPGSAAAASMRRAVDHSGPDIDWLVRGLSDVPPDRLIGEIDPADGYFRLYLPAATTATLVAGVYALDVQVTFAAAWTDDPVVISTAPLMLTATVGITD